jgi:hypothetical protein
MATATETTTLATREEEAHELSVTPQQAMAAKEIEGAIIVARKFPRNEDACRSRVMASCARHTFACQTIYGFPRGGKQIEGPSVNLAREMARCWGNVRYGFDVVHDDEESRTIRAWAWDVETNTRRSQDASFKKLIYRRSGGWQIPDERDLRELTNKHGETAVRNCLLHVMPPDLAEDAMVASRETMHSDAASNPETARKRVVDAFRTVGVTVEDLEAYLNHPLRQIMPDEITKLRTIWKSISDGNSRWAEYAKTDNGDKPNEVENGATMDDLAKPAEPGPAADLPSNPPTPEEVAADRAQLADEFAQGFGQIDQASRVAPLWEDVLAAIAGGRLAPEQKGPLAELANAAKDRLSKV